ncbi:MAG: aminotransferase class V-fold PLP-dependent enzyme [Hamadaea sp.]|uniref:pyridoxal phosphate-dependent decarboxylase family protein n=1 Tax=Hamadaea sp. TaxID=2024425 RepID=UPI00180104F1|nr:pyridoxal-dependent decarboxylase [Hamadaea sp.]NUR74505.1 aminotransferase class V-fold PLP-dependent enzyme [Hamadaea sp.]NUT21434.1 aminotransferase class V-fold PLP-dependent enzyme [Hamadaea sp.]
MTEIPPAWEWRPAEVRRIGHRVTELITEHLTTLPEQPAWQAYRGEVPPADAGPVDLDQVLDEIAEQVMPYPFGNGHPRYAAWVNSPPHVLGAYADALAATLNPSVAGGDHAAVHVEREVIRVFRELAGFPEAGTGLLVSGGSMATLTAFAVARHRAAERHGLDVRRDGLAGRRFVLYLGTEGHGTARKAAELLGFGSANVRLIPSDADHRMRPDLLREQVEADLATDVIPVAVMASTGTVNTGAIDPLAEIAEICAEHELWLHVDGSYGGPAVLLLDAYADTRTALSAVDSIALDPHKWLYTPVDAGLVLLRDRQLTRDAFSLVPPYLRTEDEPWFSEFGFEQTRPFRALKVWAQLRHLGLDGYRQLIARDLAIADRLAAAVDADAALELLAHGLSVVCFRCSGATDEENRAILAELQRQGRAFLAGTTVDGRFAFRACVVNPRMSSADAEAILDAVHAARANH